MSNEQPHTALETLSGWCAQPPGFSGRARTLAVHAIVDTLGCLVAGRDDPSVVAVRRAFSEAGAPAGNCRMAGGGRASASMAALVNGTAAHALDYDDNFLPGMSHASAVLVPALLAVAELNRAGGGKLIEAYLVGLQAQAFVGGAMGQAHYRAGWHGTSTIGCIGTAAGTAWLLGLDARGIADALSIAVSMASGTKGQFGSPAKPFHAGMAARNAVDAALLARAGMRGRPDIIEASQGFHALYAGDPGLRWEDAPLDHGGEHVIEAEGVLPKRHPCCGSAHPIIDALLDLQAEAGFHVDDITRIDTLVGLANHRNLAYPSPRDEMEARFSMQYCVARALRSGRLDLSDFTHQSVRTHASDPLLGRIAMRHRREEDETGRASWLPHVLSVELVDGTVFERSRTHARGSLADSFSDEDRRRKFLDCCQSLKGADALLGRLAGLEGWDSLDALDPLFGATHDSGREASVRAG